jgi:predicted RNA-binding protein YlxR (DUF448 family)
VACRQEGSKADLVRLVAVLGDGIDIDLTGRTPGRGAYLHPDPGCVALARRRALLERALKARVPDDVWRRLEAASEASAAPSDR